MSDIASALICTPQMQESQERPILCHRCKLEGQLKRLTYADNSCQSMRFLSASNQAVIRTSPISVV